MPKLERLALPEEYGRTTETLPWATVTEWLTAAKQYWVAINRPGSSPHVVPVDGIWTEDTLWYGGGQATAHVRLAEADPNVTVHLPDPWTDPFALPPHRAVAWSSFPRDATRYTFPA